MKKITSCDGVSNNIRKWYEEHPKTESPVKHDKSEMEVLNLKDEAKKCLNTESTAYHLKQSKSCNSEYSWLKTALSKGTTFDKVAAGIVLIQNSPKHNLNHLTSLISQVTVAKHNQSSMIITAIRDLFLNDLLHPTFKLLRFEEQDLNQLNHFNKTFDVNQETTFNKKPVFSKNKLLGIWYFEDQLKEIYGRFINALSTIANDTVDINREKAVSVMNDLLIGNAEQEQKLLDFLVNKIGDPGSKVASKAVFSLTKLLYEHPNMKLIVLREVEKFLFRTNIAPRAQYYAICLLTQFLLTKEDTEVATTLIDVYFAFFKACLKKGEPDSRMMAAILTGVNRAYPFSDISSIKLNQHINSLYKVVHVGSFNVSLNALNLLFQVVCKDFKQLDRFYSAFYRKLFDPHIGTANKRAVFLNLLFRILRNDHSVLRLHAFIKRILQICTYFPANMTCATLYVIAQVLKSKKYMSRIITRSITRIENNLKVDTSNILDETADNKKADKKQGENTIILSNVITEFKEIKNDDINPEGVEIKTEFRATCYNPFSRNPMHCGANLSFYTELKALSDHFHPSVALFANTILQGKSIQYTGDPLVDLNLIRFLDRYVFKNPKKIESKKIVKKNDPLARRAAYIPKGIRSIAVDSLAYLNEREDRIPVDELFVYQFLHKRKEFHGAKKINDEDDNESVNSEDFNSMLDQLSKSKKMKDLDELDIAGDFGSTPKKAKVINDEDDIENDISNEENSDIDEDISDELQDLSDLDEMEFDDIDDDFSDIEFNDDDDDDESFQENTPKKRKLNNSFKKNKNAKGFGEQTFVAAEEFAEMLENQGRSKFKHGSSKDLSDRDGASTKQLDWESERNQRISEFRKNKKGKKSFYNVKNRKISFKHKQIKRKK